MTTIKKYKKAFHKQGINKQGGTRRRGVSTNVEKQLEDITTALDRLGIHYSNARGPRGLSPVPQGQRVNNYDAEKPLYFDTQSQTFFHIVQNPRVPRYIVPTMMHKGNLSWNPYQGLTGSLDDSTLVGANIEYALPPVNERLYEGTEYGKNIVRMIPDNLIARGLDPNDPNYEVGEIQYRNKTPPRNSPLLVPVTTPPRGAIEVVALPVSPPVVSRPRLIAPSKRNRRQSALRAHSRFRSRHTPGKRSSRKSLSGMDIAPP